ncbi:hypothetical protein ACWET9_40270 [Streptomyces sp. NPDC004059]
MSGSLCLSSCGQEMVRSLERDEASRVPRLTEDLPGVGDADGVVAGGMRDEQRQVQHFGPLRQFTLANSHHRSHPAQTRALHAYLRWRNANAALAEYLIHAGGNKFRHRSRPLESQLSRGGSRRGMMVSRA